MIAIGYIHSVDPTLPREGGVWGRDYGVGCTAADHSKVMSTSSTSVPCNCQFCGGKLVSRFVRRQHNALYGTGSQSLKSTAKVEVRTSYIN